VANAFGGNIRANIAVLGVTFKPNTTTCATRRRSAIAACRT